MPSGRDLVVPEVNTEEDDDDADPAEVDGKVPTECLTIATCLVRCFLSLTVAQILLPGEESETLLAFSILPIS